MRLTHTTIVASLSLATSAFADGDSLAPPHLENFVIIGAGTGPDFIGSDDTTSAIAPAGRLALGAGRSATLVANTLSLDLSPHENWKIGPVGILRFARKDVDDPVIDALPDINMSVDLGLSAGYQWKGHDIRDHWQVGGGAVIDTRGDFDLQTGWVSLHRWIPVGQYGALGLSLGSTWGSGAYMDRYFSVDSGGAGLSGLPEFEAQSGVRDLRLATMYVQPISQNWALGAGFLYSKLLGDAKDSPISQSDDQLYAGIGVAYAW